MKASQVAWLVCFLAVPAAAETWDVATFDGPPWTVERSADQLGFTDVNQAAGTFCQLAISNSQPSTGDGKRDFAAEWAELVASTADVDVTPTPTAGKTPSGLPYFEGGSMTTAGTSRFYFHLLAFSPAGRRMSVRLSSGDAKGVSACRSRLGAFFSSLRFKGATPAASPRGDVGGFRGGGLAGVWMGFRDEPLLGHAPQLNWLVLFDDGQFHQNLPGEGLLGFDRAASRAQLPNSWGTYSWNGSAGLGKKPGVDARYDLKFAAGKNGQLLVDGKPYFRSVDVDGLKLQGAWTSYADPADPDLDGPPTSPRPIIRFTRDGRFVDEGVFTTFLHSTDERTDAPGEGTYAFKDFTLTLRFSDGREKRLGFTGSLGLDPAKNDTTIYLRRSAFSKRR